MKKDEDIKIVTADADGRDMKITIPGSELIGKLAVEPTEDGGYIIKFKLRKNSTVNFSKLK